MEYSKRRHEVRKVSVLPTVASHKSLWDVIIFTPDLPGSCLTCFLTVELRLQVTPPNEREDRSSKWEEKENGIKNKLCSG